MDTIRDRLRFYSADQRGKLGGGVFGIKNPVQKFTAVLFGSIAFFIIVAPRFTGWLFVPHDPQQLSNLADATMQAFGVQGLITGTIFMILLLKQKFLRR